MNIVEKFGIKYCFCKAISIKRALINSSFDFGIKEMKKIKEIKEIKKPKDYTLKDIPEDVYSFICRIQSQMKEEKKILQYSFPSAMYKIIRESKRCIEDKMTARNESSK